MMKYPASAYRMEWKAIILLLSIIALPMIAKGQATVTLSPIPHVQFLSNAGIPLASGCVNTYIAGTTTPQTTYRDSGGVNTNTNPIILNAGGFADIWLDVTKSYKFTVVSTGGVNCSTGVTQWTVDNITVPSINAILAGNNTWSGNQTFNGSVTAGGSTTLNTLTVTGAESHSGAANFLNLTGIANLTNLNNIEIVDGTVYALNQTGVNAAITAVNGRGGGKVLITKPVTITHDIVLKSNVVLECTGGWAQPLITYTGAGGGEHAIFGNNIQDSAVVGCYIKGPNLNRPPIPALTTSTSGGSLGAGVTVFVKTTYVNANGESIASTESTITTGAGATNSVTVTAPWLLVDPAGQAPAHITGYSVYSSTTTGTEKQQAASGACVNITTNCTIQVIGAGASAPTSTSAAASIDVRGIEFDGTNRHWEINNKVVGFYYGIYDGNISGGSESYINNNFVQGCVLSCIVQGDDRAQMNHNRISDCGTSNTDHCLYITGTQGVTDAEAIGNQLTFAQGFCGVAFDAGTNTVINQIRFIGNNCDYGGQAPSGTRGGFQAGIQSATDTCSGMTISDNTFSNVSGTAVIQSANCSFIAIANNTIRSYSGPAGITVSTNLAVANTDISVTGNIVAGGANLAAGDNAINCTMSGGGSAQNVSITGNVIDQNPFNGIKIFGNCTDGTITGNSIMNFNQQNASGNGIDTEANANGWVITGNRIRSVTATSTGIGIVGGNDNIVAGNDLVNNNNTFFDLGTRTQIYGNKLNATDALFRINAGALLTEQATPSAGSAGFAAISCTSDDHMCHFNPNNGGVQNLNQSVFITGSAYTNATTTFSTVTGMSFPIAASRNYALACHLYLQGSATTAGPKFQLTGPAAPGAVLLGVGPFDPIAKTTTNVSSGFSVANTTLGTIGALGINYDVLVTAGIVNGTNAGTVVLQAAANGAGTLTIQPGSWCEFK